MNGELINLTSRLFIGTITNVLKPPGYYEVKIDELLHLSDTGIIVRDISIPNRYTDSDQGSYGSFYPLQKGTKVIVKFLRNDLNSGVIISTYSDKFPTSPDNHPNRYHIFETLSKSQLYADDKDKKVYLALANSTAYLELKSDKIVLHGSKKITIEAPKLVEINAKNIHLNGGASVSSSSSSFVLGKIGYTIQRNDKLNENATIIEASIPEADNVTDITTVDRNEAKDAPQLDSNQEQLIKANTIGNNQSNKIVVYKITTIQTLSQTINNVSNEINNIEQQHQEDIQNQIDTNENIINNFIPQMYNELLLKHNNLSASITALKTSTDYQLLSDDEKAELDKILDPVYNTADYVAVELNSINTSLGLSYYKDSNSSLSSIYNDFNNIHSQLKSLDISTTYSDINNVINDVKDRLNFVNDLGKFKKLIDINIHGIDKLTTKLSDLQKNLLDFKFDNTYANVDSVHLVNIFKRKFSSLAGEILHSIDTQLSNLEVISQQKDNLSNTFKIIIPIDNVYKQKLFNFDLSTYISNISTYSTNIRNIINNLPNITVKTDFFNQLDNIYNNVGHIANSLSDIKDTLSNISDTIHYLYSCLLNGLNFAINNGYYGTANSSSILDLLSINLNAAFLDLLNKILQGVASLLDYIRSLIDVLCGSLASISHQVSNSFDSTIQSYVNDILDKYSDLTQSYAKYNKVGINLIKSAELLTRGENKKASIFNFINSYLDDIDKNLRDSKKNTMLLKQLSSIPQVKQFITSNYDKLSLHFNSDDISNIISDSTSTQPTNQLTLAGSDVIAKFSIV